MKIQELAIIFVIIILPISLLLSEYTQFQIDTLSMQTAYDAKLTAATYDAIKAFQLNAKNETYSNLDNMRVENIEASVNSFRNSIMSSFKLNGYTEKALNNYIPALVYTLYDGLYIYSPYNNVNYQYEEKKDASGNPLKDSDGNILYDENKPTQDNGKNVYGLKPYISYSCRYVKGSTDVVITYSLDNYISVQGMVYGKYINRDGYLIDGITVEPSGQVKYKNGDDEVRITIERLEEYLPLKRATDGVVPDAYPYIKLNGTKYYNVDLKADVPGDDSIIYMQNGKYLIQCQKSNIPEGEALDKGTEDYISYSEFIMNYNNLAIQYYKDAAEFTKWIREESGLENLKYSDAVNEESEQIWGDDETPIFKNNSINIENELSNFNKHRLAVIRNKIETSLAVAISNYNSYSGVASSNVFQMPELKENEWEHITHNISLISFLQGLPIGGKIYNGYSLVTNSESKEVVIEDNIYILGDDANYHRIGDNYFENGGNVNVGAYGTANSAGRLNLDFERLNLSNDVQNYYYYPLEKYYGSYDSIIMQNDVTLYDDIYSYVDTQSNDFKGVFYTALGRERISKYNSKLKYSIEALQGEKYTVSYAGNADGVTSMPENQIKIEGYDLPLDSRKPKKEGHTFKGWSTSPDGEIKYPSGSINYYDIDASVVLYAKWEINDYTVTYDLGAIDATSGPEPQPVNWNNKIQIASEIPVREGYTFKGWEIVGDDTIYTAGMDYPQAGGITKNITFYAKWERKTYAVTYDANGGSGAPASQTKTYGIDLELSTTRPTREGYSFLGWSTSPTATSATYFVGGTYKENSDATLYAVWKINTYTITYNANGGSGAPESQTKTYGQDLTLSSTKPTRAGYSFLGWSTSQTATSATYAAGGTFATNADTTLYAVWKRTSYTITFNANGGSGAPGNQTKIHGTDLTLSSTKPTRNEYTFLGWSTSSTATSATYSSGGTFTTNADTTLYAVWKYSGKPIYTYTGKSTFIDDGNGNWRIKFLTSGTLTFTNMASTNIDVFCVGGGGGGGSRPATGTGGGGGGGGYTTTSSNITITLGNSFNVTIGAGGAANGGRGGTTSFLSVSAAGGYGGSNGHGGAGGSGRRRRRRNWLWRWLSLV